MPIHDWTRVDAGIFHDFHHSWIAEIQRVLNRGVLPPEYYALAEQIAGGLGPHLLTLQQPANRASFSIEPSGGVALATFPPQVELRLRAERDIYAAKAKSVVIHHKSSHRVIAIVEIVSPGNKSSRHGLRAFVDKVRELLRAGIHLLIIDLFPPGPRDPHGIHRILWDELAEEVTPLPADRPLTLVAYKAGADPEAFVQPVGVGLPLRDMPLFLIPEVYVPVPLEATYAAAWDAVPSFWREVVMGEPGPGP